MTQICGLDFRSNLLSPCIPSSDATFLRHANCLDFSISLSPCVFQGASLSLSNTRFCATAMRRVWNNRILWTKACLQMDAKWIWGVKLKWMIRDDPPCHAKRSSLELLQGSLWHYLRTSSALHAKQSCTQNQAVYFDIEVLTIKIVWSL